MAASHVSSSAPGRYRLPGGSSSRGLPAPLRSRLPSCRPTCARRWATPISCAGLPTPSKTNRRFPWRKSRLSQDDWPRSWPAGEDPVPFARELGPLLSSSTSHREAKLVANTPRVIGITRRLTLAQRHAILRCVRIMSRGMVEFQRNASTEGLAGHWRSWTAIAITWPGWSAKP